MFKSKNGLLGWQPTVETHSKYIMKEDGVPYEKLHIVSIKASANNTIMTLSDHTGGVLFSTSAVNFIIAFHSNKK